MPARNCVWRQPNDADRGPSIQLTRKLARYWVKSVEQKQVPRARARNPNSPKKGATPAPGALLQSPAPTEMLNLWPTVPSLNERVCDRCHPRNPPGKPNHAQKLADNRPGKSLDREQLPY